MSLLQIFRDLSLRTKFVLPMSVVLLVSTLIMSGYLIDRLDQGFRRELESNGETIARLVATNAESGVLFESRYELDALLKQVGQFDDVIYASIVNNDGTVLAEIGSWDETQVQRRFKIDVSLAGETSDDYRLITADGRELVEVGHPVYTRREQLDREVLGMVNEAGGSLARGHVDEKIGKVRVVLSLDRVMESIAVARSAAIILAFVVFIAAIVLLTFFIRVVTQPIKQLVQVTDQVSRGDLSRTVDVQQRDEIGHLATTFNRMIVSLSQSREEIEEYNRTLEQKIIDRTLELEEAQAQLVQSEKMSAIGQLAAGVAHELNNPLGGILGYAQFALEKMRKQAVTFDDSKAFDSYIRYLGDIETQARRCKTIVQNLLRFSRSSRVSEFTEVDVNQVIEDTRTFVEHQLNMNQISLEVEYNRDIPTIQANAGQLQQVFTNLIINAMHASPPESTVRIVVRYSPALGEFGGALEILVIDEGAGIPAEDIKKIFEPFFTTKDVGKGTGLGLSVSYGIIREHGGEIRVDSEVGKGTVFTIILPVQKQGIPSDKGTKDIRHLQ